MYKKVVGEIAQIKGIDLAGVYPLIDRSRHLFEGLGEQVLGIFISEHAEIRHAGSYDGDTPSQFSTFLHIQSLLDCKFKTDFISNPIKDHNLFNHLSEIGYSI